MRGRASMLEEPRALFTITPTGSCSAGKMSLVPFPPMLQFLSSVSREQFYSPPLQVTVICRWKLHGQYCKVSYSMEKNHQFPTFHHINFPGTSKHSNWHLQHTNTMNSEPTIKHEIHDATARYVTSPLQNKQTATYAVQRSDNAMWFIWGILSTSPNRIAHYPL